MSTYIVEQSTTRFITTSSNGGNQSQIAQSIPPVGMNFSYGFPNQNNCFNCINCPNSLNCNNCKDCQNCINCNNCVNCMNCVNCNNCANASGLTNANNIVNNSNISTFSSQNNNLQGLPNEQKKLTYSYE